MFSESDYSMVIWAIASDSLDVLITSLENQGKGRDPDVCFPKNIYDSKSLRKERDGPRTSP